MYAVLVVLGILARMNTCVVSANTVTGDVPPDRELSRSESPLVDRISVDEMRGASHASTSNHHSGQDLHGSSAPQPRSQLCRSAQYGA